jgi:integrase
VPHSKLFLLLLVYTAARHHALTELLWDQVDFDQNVIDLRPPGKKVTVLDKGSKKGRAIVPMSGELRAALLVAKENAETPFVLEYGGRRLDYMFQAFNNARARAGLGKDVTPHVLRHTVATWLRTARDDWSAIAGLLGHDDEETTRTIYGHVEVEALKPTVNLIEQRLGKGLRVVK